MKTTAKRVTLYGTMALGAAVLTIVGLTVSAGDHQSGAPDGVGVSPAQIQGNVPNGTSAGWELVSNLSDEFNGSAISQTKWDTTVPQFDGPWSWDPANTTQANGNLNITMRQSVHTAQIPNQDGKKVATTINYTSGILKSRATMVFGYYEARIQGVFTFPGSSPAFWLYSNAAADAAAGLIGTQNGDTAYSEVDVVEMEQEKSINVLDMHAPYQVIQNGKPVFVRRTDAPYTPVTVQFDPSKAFHTYGVMVSSQSLTYYVDGKQVLSQPNTHWNRLQLNVTLSLGLRTPNSTYTNCPNNLRRCPTPGSANAAGYPTTMKVDWVRVYKPKP